ncbi:MAG: disulfide bond formation protein B [Hyphomicrobiales bacterium]|nr:disulfide bond formation protein B [Hyphomicrobiales bacterium]
MPLVSLLRRRDLVALALGLAAVAVVATAWGFELIGGFTPCRLCLEQRLPYYFGAPLALLAFASDRFRLPEILPRLMLVALAGLFAWGLWVGAFQAGAEWGWWPGPADCSGTRLDAMPSAGDLLANLNKVKAVDCTKPQIRILGLSFAGWNVIASLGLIAVALFAAWKGEGRR